MKLKITSDVEVPEEVGKAIQEWFRETEERGTAELSLPTVELPNGYSYRANAPMHLTVEQGEE